MEAETINTAEYWVRSFLLPTLQKKMDRLSRRAARGIKQTNLSRVTPIKVD